ncbi:phosphatases II [Basidiobolus meristosporus CBS 931.73]|uniref:Phosphatases II n=1 Tax=Basidiobolus meristosporus CBS 931.73 TaxID=1314790 RepID=A0A1Y1YK98_9FUNG|nr:phosphatases II [Basidiobolus meristosporus CBS 931.73]ORX98402.1 phosphatases II [Basidiobolus meristosporus CBS 931.73]|eukprot:ORX77679.1 phosphatases II [Basidiobolus meristosporus CBS 931.73]
MIPLEGNVDISRLASYVSTRLWLGTRQAAGSVEFLEQQKITHILVVGKNLAPAFPYKFVYETIPVLDRDEENILQYFDQAYEFISGALDQSPYNTVLLHCSMGISSSAAFAVAYLMRRYQLRFEYALERIRQCRKCVCPNQNFRRQLALYETMNYRVRKISFMYLKFSTAMAFEKNRGTLAFPGIHLAGGDEEHNTASQVKRYHVGFKSKEV